MSLDICQVLIDFNIRYKETPGKQVLVLCPFHEDTNPSGIFFLDKGTYYCPVCDLKGNIYSYLAQKLSKSRRYVYTEIQAKYTPDKSVGLNPLDIHRWHENIWKNEGLLKVLYDHKLTDEVIREYKLGEYSDDVISIPIYNEHNKYVNVRLYRPGSDIKFSSLRRPKKDQFRLHPIDQLAFDRIVICGGECKALALIPILNPEGIGALSPTCGENIWKVEWNGSFEGKDCYVCSDIDIAGVKSAEQRCRAIKNSCSRVFKIELPLDIEKYPTGDINNFLFEGGDFLKLLNEAEEWHLKSRSVDITEEAVPVDLNTAVSAEVTGKRVSLSAVISVVDQSPYSIPKRVEVECPRDQDYCAACHIFMNYKEDEQIVELSSESIAIIEMISEELRKQERILKRALQIPAKCTECIFHPLEHFSVEDCRVSQELNISNRNAERSMQIAYCVGKGVDLNETYLMEGRQYPHPKNQQATLLISNYEVTDDALSCYKPTDLTKLEKFQTNGSALSDIQAKIDEIYEDIEANVTRTFERRHMHLMFDLAYHSPLFINLGKDRIKGWVEVLVLGDSGMAKSMAIERLAEFYKLGEIVSCKSATVPGLMGGCQQTGKGRWFAEWGKFVSHDKRIIILEEFNGMPSEVFEALTNMRTSGIAEVNKIKKGRAYARTRLIVVSNPRSDRVLSAYNYGIDAIKELIKTPQDLRRFDAAIILERSEIDVDEMMRREVDIEHEYVAELCRELILFAWTRENVKFENPTYMFDVVKRLCEKYEDSVQIVYKATQRDKIARLSAALAARLFSIEDEDTILVKNEHIEYIAQYLDAVYSTPAFGYVEFSDKIRESNRLINRRAVIQRIKESKYPIEFVDVLLRHEWIDHQLIQDIQDYDPNTARKLLSFLFRQHALNKEGRLYRKSNDFTSLLKQLSQNGELREEKPNFLKEKKDEF